MENEIKEIIKRKFRKVIDDEKIITQQQYLENGLGKKPNIEEMRAYLIGCLRSMAYEVMRTCESKHGLLQSILTILLKRCGTK